MTNQAAAHKAYQAALAADAKGNPQLAYDFLLEAIELDSEQSAYRLNMALVAERLAKPSQLFHDAAYFQASEAVRLNPDNLGTLWGFAQTALATHRFKEAIHGYKLCLKHQPENAGLWCILGFAYLKMDRMDEAEPCLLKAVELDPDLGQAHFLLCTLYTNERHDDAKIAYHGEQAFTVKNKATLSLEAMWNAAHGFLGIGCYEKGFGYFEARLQRNTTNWGRALLSTKFPVPMWKGERDCTICIAAEMGIGDVFLLLRYFPIIERDFGVKVIFEGSAKYNTLVRYNFPSVMVVEDARDKEFDYHIPIMSLPYICQTRADTIPWDGAYIRPEPLKLAEWHKVRDPSRPNVGVCWSTGANLYNFNNYEVFRKKSVPWETFKPVTEVPGINFVSLQADAEAANFPNPGIKTFSDTAAIMAHMDMIVTVDTSVANLAGAMDCDTLLLDRADADWRFFSKLKKPWYPSVRPVRQTKLYDWEPVITTTIDRMNNLIAENSAKV